MAANDEMGLSIRDGALREHLPQQTDVDNLPFDMLVAIQSTYDVEAAIFHRTNEHWEFVWDDMLTFPRKQFYEHLVTAIEVLSRNELRQSLESAGFKAQPRPASRDSSVLPEGIEKQLADLTVPAQFALLRELHSEISKNGDSPELLGALARSYAIMGVLTECLWSPAHKVFKARSLLYAERAVSKWPQSSIALQSRAFARALVGLHASALQDLRTSKKPEHRTEEDEHDSEDSQSHRDKTGPFFR